MELADVKGVGPKMLQNLHELNIYHVEDLLTYYPYRYDLFEPTIITVMRHHGFFIMFQAR